MTFNDALILAIERWNENPIPDEWLFEKFREQFVNTLTTEEAFKLIDATLEVLLRQSDESTAIETLQTIIALARQSKTTEVTPRLLAQKSTLENQFATFGVYANGKLQELFHYYRL